MKMKRREFLQGCLISLGLCMVPAAAIKENPTHRKWITHTDGRVHHGPLDSPAFDVGREIREDLSRQLAFENGRVFGRPWTTVHSITDKGTIGA